MSALARLREICEKAEKSWDVLRLTPPEVLALIDALEVATRCLEEVEGVPFSSEGSISYKQQREEDVRWASKALETIEEKLKGLG